jgi:hypothetical protein
MTLIQARRPYTAPKVGATYNATEIRTQLALLAQAISPQFTRSVIFASPATDKVVLVTDDLIVCDTTGGSFAITLPLVNVVQFLRVTLINIGANTLTITGTVSGAVNPTLAQWKSSQIQSDGTRFMKIGGVV